MKPPLLAGMSSNPQRDCEVPSSFWPMNASAALGHGARKEVPGGGMHGMLTWALALILDVLLAALSLAGAAKTALETSANAHGNGVRGPSHDCQLL